MRKNIDRPFVWVNPSIIQMVSDLFGSDTNSVVLQAAHLGARLLEADSEAYSRMLPNNASPDQHLLERFRVVGNMPSRRIPLEPHDAQGFESISRTCLPDFPTRAGSGFSLALTELMLQALLARELMVIREDFEFRVDLGNGNDLVFFRDKPPKISRWIDSSS